MAQNKNALIRYRTIDRCLRNTGRRWTLADLVEACSDALYDLEGRDENIGTRTIQRDIEMMRSDKLGYEAPIEVYDRKYYRYSDPEYSISNRRLKKGEIDVLNRAIDLLRQFDEFDPLHEMAEVVGRLQDKVATAEKRRKIVDFDHNARLQGLGFMKTLYDMTASRTVVQIVYQSFKAHSSSLLLVHPHLLKEYNNRWFLICTRDNSGYLATLALDRMEAVEPRPDVAYRDNPALTDDYFNDVIGVTKHSRLTKATVIFTARSGDADYIRTKPFHPYQRIAGRNLDGSTTFEIPDIIINPELCRLLVSFADGITVLSPASLAAEVMDAHRRASTLYTTP